MKLCRIVVLLGSALWPCAAAALRAGDDSSAPTREQLDHFERHVRPVLAMHCFSCHGAKKQESGLRLDSREAVLRGGERGAAATPGNVEGSVLIQAVRQAGELKMPPEGKLKPQEVAALESWVRGGLAWPGAVVAKSLASKSSPGGRGSMEAVRASHWAFRPIRKPALPPLKNTQGGWAATPIDRFIQARLEALGLAPSPPADRRTLIRRATFDLIGLPPTPEEIAAFENDPLPDETAFARLVERLLASPHYGERWGRHWLDVARYADNKGYVFFEEKKYPWAYTYRDFVIRAFNDDLPFDRFVLYQLAADQLDLADKRLLTALGFITVGGRFMNNTHDVIDDRIDVITRGLMGLTVTCARCHDHKYDPIPTADYYSLYGVLRSSTEPAVPPMFEPPPKTEAYRKFADELAVREKKLHDFVDQKHAELVNQARTRAGDYLLAAHTARHHPRTDDFMLLTDKGELNPSMIVRWQRYLEKTRSERHPVWGLWHVLSDLPEADFAQAAAKATADARGLNPLVLAALREKPPKSMAEAAQRFGEILARVDRKWQETLKPAQATDKPLPKRLDDPAEEELRLVLYGDGTPPSVAKVFDWGFLSLLPDRPSQAEFEKLLKAMESWAMSGPGAPPRAMVLQDVADPYEPRVFLRGNANRPGPAVPRQFAEVLSRERRPFQRGSGRLELAQAIVDPANPLTARVIVNRVWMHHFGKPLVDTPSDFGMRSDPPTHPELLDYLAATFVQRGWSLKDLHRRIMTSAAYQQSSADRPECITSDPENRLLWKMNRRRLEFEPLRDALLAVSDSLDRRIGGPSVEMFDGGFVPRRTLYGSIDRLDLPTLLTTFDYPNPATTTPRRDQTTVPPQALFLMNHPFVEEAAKRVAGRLDVTEKASDEGLLRLYELLLGRRPSVRELALTRQYVGGPNNDRFIRLIHGLLMSNGFAFVD
jgi:hypothetical protein